MTGERFVVSQAIQALCQQSEGFGQFGAPSAGQGLVGQFRHDGFHAGQYFIGFAQGFIDHVGCGDCGLGGLGFKVFGGDFRPSVGGGGNLYFVAKVVNLGCIGVDLRVCGGNRGGLGGSA